MSRRPPAWRHFERKWAQSARPAQGAMSFLSVPPGSPPGSPRRKTASSAPMPSGWKRASQPSFSGASSSRRFRST